MKLNIWLFWRMYLADAVRSPLTEKAFPPSSVFKPKATALKKQSPSLGICMGAA
jgi:hypothetical protein